MAAITPFFRSGLEPFEQMRRDFEDLFGRVFGGSALADRPAGMMRAFAPQVDVEETEKEITVRADLPGIQPQEVEITVSGGDLIMQGERREERKDEAGRRYERFVGRFYREIPLGSGVDLDNISATGSHGVLTVRIPKKPEMQPKRIPVKTEAAQTGGQTAGKTPSAGQTPSAGANAGGGSAAQQG